MAIVIGIHLGNTNSCAATRAEDGNLVVIPNAEGALSTPSVVAFTKSAQPLLGQAALCQVFLNPENTIHSAKRFLGHTYAQAQTDSASVLYKIVKAPDGKCKIGVLNTEYTFEEISAMILAKLKQDAEEHLGERVACAVIAVPPHFTDEQRMATKNAGTIAGLDILRIINESTAAAIAYGLTNDSYETENILAFHLGGSSSTVTILDAGDGVFELKSKALDTNLGGNDFDQCIVNWLVDEFQKTESVKLHLGRQTLQRLNDAAQKAKIEISSVAETTIWLPSITADTDNSLHLELKLTRERFDQLTAHLVERCRSLIKQALIDADLPCPEKVVVIGGSTKIPAVQQMIRTFTSNEPLQFLEPDHVVALGAAIQADILSRPTHCSRLLACEIAFEDLIAIMQNLSKEHNDRFISPQIEFHSCGPKPEVSFRVKKYACVWKLAAFDAILSEYYVAQSEAPPGDLSPQHSYHLTRDTATLSRNGQLICLKDIAQNAMNFILQIPDLGS